MFSHALYPIKKNIVLPFLFASLYTYSQTNEDFSYFLLGLRRGIRSISTGAQIIANYYISGVSEDSHEYAARKLYKLFKTNSGTYIKLGQSLSQSEHVLPEPFIRNLEPLCQEAPMTEISKVKKMIEEQLKVKFEEFFEYFEEVPLGSASLAQVHKAKIKQSGEEVAMKVQHPMIGIYCPSDVAIVKFATKVGEILWPGVKLQWIAKEFQRNIMREIDFTNEGENADKIRNFCKDDDFIVIPQIKWNYSTKKILTMSFEEGKSIVNSQYRLENKIGVNEIAELLAKVFNRQIFEFGFVHSDPHHGNLFIRKEKVNGREKLRLVLLDHGLYTHLDDDFKHYYSLLWRGIFTQSPEFIHEACKGLNVKNPELFVTIVTNKSYQNIMKEEFKYSTRQRLGPKEKLTADDKLRIHHFIRSNLKNLTLTLDGMRSEMILVLKINGFLRSIDKRIGNPINNFNIMMKYVYKEVIDNCKRKAKGTLELIQIYSEYYKFRLIIFWLNFYYAIFYSWRIPKEIEQTDLAVNI